MKYSHTVSGENEEFLSSRVSGTSSDHWSLKYYKFCSCSAINTLRLSYEDQSVAAVLGSNSCFL
jgi:hypothetical protein